MPHTVLITGKPSRLATELVREALASGDRVVATQSHAEEQTEDGEALDDNVRYVRWNSRSPISTRSVVMEAINAFGQLNEVFIVFVPDGVYSPFHETSPSAFEHTVDRLVKSYLFMVKEVLAYFQRSGSGAINMVLHDAIADFAGPLDACVRGAFRALSDALFNYYQNEPVTLRGFYSSSKHPHGFARYILTTTREKGPRSSGRWYRHSARARLFSRGR